MTYNRSIVCPVCRILNQWLRSLFSFLLIFRGHSLSHKDDSPLKKSRFRLALVFISPLTSRVTEIFPTRNSTSHVPHPATIPQNPKHDKNNAAPISNIQSIINIYIPSNNDTSVFDLL